MQNANLTDLYFTALRKMHHGEKLIVDALPNFIEQVATDDLKSALGDHQKTVGEHQARLETILENMTDSAINLQNLGVDALIDEANRVIDAYDQGDVQDAALTAVIQHIAHYKIACYGSLSTYAKTLDRSDEMNTLLKTLEEENQHDKQLKEIAKQIINVNAAG